MENLRTHPAVGGGVAGGGLALHGWVYKIETGQVFAYDPDSGQFTPLADGPTGPVPPPARLTEARSI
jgi:carbonic anhydrase